MDINDIPQTNPTDDINAQPVFTEGGEGMLYTETPVVEHEAKPEVEKTVETETPKAEQPIVEETPKATPISTPATEQITTLNAVDKRTNDVIEHDVVTKDKLSQLADDDENGFIEQVETAHNAKP